MDNIGYFDGHNDVLLKLYYSKSQDPSKDFFDGNDYCHIDFKKIEISNFIGGFFAIFVPDKEPDFNFFSRMEAGSYDFPLPEPISYDHAIKATNKMIEILNKIIRASNGKIVLCNNGKDIDETYKNNNVGVILHIEGAEAIDKNFKSLEKLYEQGLRSIGLVWSRPNIFATGVPFSFPKSPDIGPGLTSIGKELVKICDEKNILIDLSHLNERGFWDVANLSSRPLIATHSNSHEFCEHSRNLTNYQLKAIKESKGIVGINFATAFLRPDGRMISDTSLDLILKHADHLIEHLGEEGVAIGSDFDGAVVPDKIKDLSGINLLKQRMYESNYGKEIIEKIFFKNWINFLKTNL
tara:strand:- start:433 stop:1488 length:1056 start_codon:yes stop_codon:yes gene_type:complete